MRGLILEPDWPGVGQSKCIMLQEGTKRWFIQFHRSPTTPWEVCLESSPRFNMGMGMLLCAVSFGDATARPFTQADIEFVQGFRSRIGSVELGELVRLMKQAMENS